MKLKSFFTLAILLIFFLSGMVNAGFAAPQEKGKEVKSEKLFIPKEVKAILQQGLASKQGRQDIPVTLERHFYLPAQTNYYCFFFLKMKNEALGFAQPAPQPGAQPAAQPQAGNQLQARFNVFLQFNKIEAGKAPEVTKEIYVPAGFAEDAAAYDPQKENLYSFGYPLPSGNYLLALAVTSLDLKKVGTLYYEFKLPEANSFANNMEATFLFTKKMDNLDAPETRTNLHKDCFTYSTLKVFPNIDNTFKAGEDAEILMFVFGSQPTADNPQKYALETNFEVKKGEETVVKWATSIYEFPLIMQTLPLKQTKQTKEGDKIIKTETVDLPAGQYTLVVKMTDKTANKALNKSIPFEVK